jgi:hypothetical protein
MEMKPMAETKIEPNVEEMERLGEVTCMSYYRTAYGYEALPKPSWAEMQKESRDFWRTFAADLLKTHAVIPRAERPVLGNSDVQIYLDGNKWCALIGENLQVGESGWGDTPQDALTALLKTHDLVPKSRAQGETNLEEVERIAQAIHGTPWASANDRVKYQFRCYARSLQKTHTAIPLPDYTALVRKAQMVDAVNKDLVALAKQCAELRTLLADREAELQARDEAIQARTFPGPYGNSTITVDPMEADH